MSYLPVRLEKLRKTALSAVRILVFLAEIWTLDFPNRR